MTGAFKPKHQRLALVVLALVAMIGAALLAAWALRNQASYFYVPSDLVASPPAAGQAVRLGGMVEAGSIRTEADGVTVIGTLLLVGWSWLAMRAAERRREEGKRK